MMTATERALEAPEHTTTDQSTLYLYSTSETGSTSEMTPKGFLMLAYDYI